MTNFEWESNLMSKTIELENQSARFKRQHQTDTNGKEQQQIYNRMTMIVNHLLTNHVHI